MYKSDCVTHLRISVVGTATATAFLALFDAFQRDSGDKNERNAFWILSANCIAIAILSTLDHPCQQIASVVLALSAPTVATANITAQSSKGQGEIEGPAWYNALVLATALGGSCAIFAKYFKVAFWLLLIAGMLTVFHFFVRENRTDMFVAILLGAFYIFSCSAACWALSYHESWSLAFSASVAIMPVLILFVLKNLIK